MLQINYKILYTYELYSGTAIPPIFSPHEYPEYNTKLSDGWGSNPGTLENVEYPLHCHYSQADSDQEQ